MEKDHDNGELHPLFMSELPQDMEGNADLAALVHLDYDGTPEEAAESEKIKGNNALARNNSQAIDEALNHYNRAISLKSKDQKANSIYFANRAQINLKRGNYDHGEDLILTE
jgi:hypothetical protein